MREKIRVILLANAGILLEGTGARLLIDGLYDPAGTEFQAVPEPVKARLLAGEPPVDLLAFTHLHPDHFSRRETETYLARNRVRGVLLPEDGGPLGGVGAAAWRADYVGFQRSYRASICRDGALLPAGGAVRRGGLGDRGRRPGAGRTHLAGAGMGPAGCGAGQSAVLPEPPGPGPTAGGTAAGAGGFIPYPRRGPRPLGTAPDGPAAVGAEPGRALPPVRPVGASGPYDGHRAGGVTPPRAIRASFPRRESCLTAYSRRRAADLSGQASR